MKVAENPCFSVGDRVSVRQKGGHWRDGVVTQLVPLKVKPDGWGRGYKWYQVEPCDDEGAHAHTWQDRALETTAALYHCHPPAPVSLEVGGRSLFGLDRGSEDKDRAEGEQPYRGVFAQLDGNARPPMVGRGQRDAGSMAKGKEAAAKLYASVGALGVVGMTVALAAIYGWRRVTEK